MNRHATSKDFRSISDPSHEPVANDANDDSERNAGQVPCSWKLGSSEGSGGRLCR